MMETRLFHQLVIGQRFWKDGQQFEKTHPIRSPGCGCRIEANATLIGSETPLRLFADHEEVFIEVNN